MIRRFSPLQIITDPCPRIYNSGPYGPRNGGIQMVRVWDCEACRRLQEIDYNKRLVGCGETITKTLIDFGAKPSGVTSKVQLLKSLYPLELPYTPAD